MNFVPVVMLFFNFTIRMFEHVSRRPQCIHLSLECDMEYRRWHPMEIFSGIIINLFCGSLEAENRFDLRLRKNLLTLQNNKIRQNTIFRCNRAYNSYSQLPVNQNRLVLSKKKIHFNFAAERNIETHVEARHSLTVLNEF